MVPLSKDNPKSAIWVYCKSSIYGKRLIINTLSSNPKSILIFFKLSNTSPPPIINRKTLSKYCIMATASSAPLSLLIPAPCKISIFLPFFHCLIFDSSTFGNFIFGLIFRTTRTGTPYFLL
ncbi:MAG: hypothetical protein CSB06_03865 [Bacteroidia bacterium]|nr:MAG: hypothetical protein CSB06_03865 [Bacteroidia bacterium]